MAGVVAVDGWQQAWLRTTLLGSPRAVWGIEVVLRIGVDFLTAFCLSHLFSDPAFFVLGLAFGLDLV